jgi:uncharacterized membrane protein
MSRLISHIRRNILFGVVVLLPVALITYIGWLIYSALKKASQSFLPQLGADSYSDIAVLILAAFVVVLLTCYFLGLILKTQIGKSIFEWAEDSIRSALPVYGVISNIVRGVAGNEITYPPALITLTQPGSAVLGFIMEEGAGDVTVFIPSAPVVTVGAIHVVERSRVQPLDCSSMDAANCITGWGVGLKHLRKL